MRNRNSETNSSTAGRELEASWAWSQVEAMADGSLSAEERRRMRRGMQLDPALARAVERARAVRAALTQLPSSTVPRRLPAALLRIPGGLPSGAHPPHRRVRWAAAAVGIAAAAAAAWAMLTQLPASSPPGRDPSTASTRKIDSASNDALRESSPASNDALRDIDPASYDALRDLAAAIRYAESGAEITRRGVAREVGRGVAEAIEIGRGAIIDNDSDQHKGG